MDRFIRRWQRLLIGLVPVALVLAGCSGAAGGVGGPAPLGEDAAVLTINVDLTDDAVQPSSIHIPVGKPVQLVLRNRGNSEHHFIVQGLVPKDMTWFIRPEGPRESEMSDAEHSQHNHATEFVPFRFVSPAGIKPTGKEVHGYALASDMDVILFTATNKGTYTVKCPLHPTVVATVTVS